MDATPGDGCRADLDAQGQAVTLGSTCNCPQCSGTLEAPEAPECPETCASWHPLHSKCGALMDDCQCFLHKYLGFSPCEFDAAPECDCPSPKEIKDDREEARAEARRDDR